MQCDTGVKVVPAHDAMPHATPVPACSHVPAPVQLPVLPHGGAAGQPRCGSGTPAPTLAHVPVAHVSQRPQPNVAQQTPSTQKSPVRQSVVVAQVWPRRRFVPHRPVCLSQMSGSRQSASTEHAALHAETPLHRYGAHDCVVAAAHVPAPSQLRTLVSVDAPAGQEAAMQAVPAA